MGQTIAIVNEKGGVGKSTTTASLAVALATGPENHRVLVVDCDAQGHACKPLGSVRDSGPGMKELVWDGAVPGDVIRPHPTVGGIGVIPASRAMSRYDVSLADDPGRLAVLREILQPVRDGYDYVLMDLPPGLGLVHLGAYMAADWVLAPVIPEADAVDGLVDLLEDVERAGSDLGAPARLLGVIVTMADLRTLEHRANIQELREELGDLVFDSVVRTTTRVREAARERLTVLEYDPQCTASRDYLAVASELTRRIRREATNAR